MFLTYGYLHSNAGYTSADAKRAFWKTVYNLGFIWGLVSIVVIVAGATALHNTLISISLTMTYICLDVARSDWRFTKENKVFQAVFALWITVPALLTPFWALAALLKALVAMIGNLLLAPAAVAVIFYFVNRRQMGEFKANGRRNLLLGTTLVFRWRSPWLEL